MSSPLVIGLIVLAAPGVARETRSVAAADTVLVLELRPMGVPAADAATVTTQLADQLAQRSALHVVSTDDINALAKNQKERSKLGCQDEACIAELSRLASARYVLTGTLGAVGGEVVLSLSVLDTAKSAPVGSAARTVASIDDVLGVVGELLAEAFQWQQEAPPPPRFALPDGAHLSLAVMDLAPLGISATLAQNVTQLLAAELKQIAGAQVISRDDIASMLELEVERSKMEGCSDDLACLAEIGGALGVDKLVVGHLGRVGDSHVISLRLIDAKQVRVDSRVTEMFRGREEQLLRAVRFAGRHLLGVAERTNPGTLALAGTEAEAAVFVDEEPVGALPLPPLAALLPGRHSVRVQKDDFLDWRSDIYVEAGGTTAVWAELLEAPTKWYRSWWFWTAVGAVVVGAGSAVAVYVATQAPSPDVAVNPGGLDAAAVLGR